MIEGAQSRETAARTVVEVGTVGLGLAIGGPVGALIAAAVKPALELIAVREQRGLDNIEQVVESVTESTGLSPDELAAWARSSDGRLMLTTNVIQTAYNTLYETKVAALATVLVENLRDEARLDVGEAVVAALADLEARHVRVLHAIDREDLPRRPDGLDHVPGVAIQSQLEASFPNLAHGILPIMAALERHKIVEETMGLRRGRPGLAYHELWSPLPVIPGQSSLSLGPPVDFVRARMTRARAPGRRWRTPRPSRRAW